MKTLEVQEKYLKAKRFAPETISALNTFFKQLNEFSTEFPSNAGEVTEFLRWLEEQKKLSDISLRLKYTFLKMVYKFLHRFYKIENPMDFVDPIKVQHRQRRYFTPEQVSLIISACQTDYERALILTLIDSACRVGELTNLRPEDVDNNQIRVKGKTGERTYRLDPLICNVLHRLPTYNGFIFKAPSSDNIKFPSHALHEKVNRVIVRAGITGKKLGAHTLRHTSASLVAKKSGGNILAVKALLQHSDAKTSQIYIHDVESGLQQNFSPLQLVKDKLSETDSKFIKQSLMLTDGSIPAINTETIIMDEQINKVDELLESSYEKTPKGTTIRPKLKDDDCDLIRRAFICLSQYGQITTDGAQSRTLWRRMTRLVSRKQSNDTLNLDELLS